MGPSFSRRQPDTHRGRATKVRSRNEGLGRLRCGDGEFHDTQEGRKNSGGQEKWPLPETEAIRVLGVDLDAKLSFAAHATSILNRAKIRVGIFSELSGCTWGEEAGVLRLTVTSLAISLPRYGLAMVGPGAYEQLLDVLDTGAINTLTR